MSSPQPSVTPPSKGFKPIFLIIALLVAIVFLGAYSALSSKQTQLPSPPVPNIPSSKPPVQSDPTANWKTYKNAELSFKYPTNWDLSSNGKLVTSSNPKVRLSITAKNETLMSECMKQDSTENRNGVALIKFSRVTTGAMCSTNDSTPREIWVVPSAVAYAPGISYTYSSTEASKAESIFDQILSTFKFTDQTKSISNSPTPTVSMETYIDKDFGYKITYPKTEWEFERTYGKDIEKLAPTDILSGIQLTKRNGIYVKSTIVVNLLDTHGLTDIDAWITKYDLNYPKNSTKENVVFQSLPAIKYLYHATGEDDNEALYFISGQYIYRIYYFETSGLSQETRNIVNSFKP